MALALTMFTPFLPFLFLVSLSYSLYDTATVYASPPSDHLSFSLTYRDAEGSPLRSVEAIPADLPQDMPMRASVAAGRALRARLNMKRKPVKANQPLLGRLSYAGDHVGEFYLTVPVGTPPQNIIFLLDTGSELILTQCSPCLNCTKTTAPSFTYQKSSSFRAISCDSPACINSVGVTANQDCNLASGQPSLCGFATAYADGSADSGFFSVDSFALGPAFSKSFVFGCATIVQEPHTTPFSGTMGLDGGPFSFPSQLFFGSPRIQKKFAYCLPDRMKSLNAAGTIKFGNYNQLPRMRHTPFAPPVIPLGSLYYFVELQEIKVGGRRIKVDKGSAKGIVGGGGTYFDSGADLTYLVEPLYDRLIREMRRQTAHLGPFNASATELKKDLCYKVAASTKEPPKVPAISMHFAGGVDLELGPGSLLTADAMQGGHANIYFCFAFLRSPVSSNVIGNYQTQNYWVEYDLDASTLGLAKANCAHVK